MRKSLLYFVVSVFTSLCSFGQSGSVYTVAGGGTSTADGVPATNASLSNVTGVATDYLGNIYFSDNGHSKIRKVDVTSGLIYTIAGNGTSASTGDGGPATSAGIATHRAIFVDVSGSVYIAEQGGKIRKVDASTGYITLIGGGGGSTAEGVPATSANLGEQLSVCVDNIGNVYCSGVNKVRKINSATGIITTVAGGGSSTIDGVPATDASIPSGIKSISLDNSGNIYIISHSGTPVRRVDAASGLIYTIAGGGSSSADGILATASSLWDAHSCKVDGAGNLFIADWSGNKVRRVDVSTGIITTIAGSGVGGSGTEGLPALSSAVDPYQIALDATTGTIYFTNYSDKVRKFSYTPIVPFLSCTGTPSAGIGTPNTTSACATTGVSIVLSGYASGAGVSFQWERSVDSIMWSTVTGATSTTYTFSGLTSMMYYRCKTSCSSSGLAAYSPGVKITYTPVCPCVFSAGNAYVNTTSACATTSITLADTGYTVTGIALQWQSSPDSVAWTDISGATAATHTFPGLSATTYYRCKATCTSAGTSLFTAGRKVIFTTTCICTGMPIAGTATASTTFCSSCSLSLGLTGSTSFSGLSYQWERSFTGTGGWSAIAGATTVPFSYSPNEALYYRCKVTCATSGLSAYSSPVFVGYAYSVVADSVGRSSDTTCSLARVFVRVNGLSPLLRIKTFYGDGQQDSLTLTAAGLVSYSSVLHSYSTPGAYSVKRVLYYNNVAQDTIFRSYEHPYCNLIPLKLYFDNDGNCSKGSAELFNTTSVMIKVDSNGITVNTYSATSGIYYKANGPVGTVYSFSLLPGSRVATCPAGGIITVPITATTACPVQYFGLSCGSGSLSDLAISAVVPVTGRHDQWGHIYLRNNYCVPTDATVTLKYSFKYSDHASWHLVPSSWTPPVLTWTIPGVTVGAPQTDMYFVGWAPSSAYLVAGDTVVEDILVTPGTGSDCDMTNNHIIRVDTVKASCDPNLIEVTPAGCFDTNTHFQFTVHFENTGNDTAHNIYVLDTLSDYLDVNTLRLVMSSAEVMNVYPYVAGGHNIVKFDFPGIKLLDSSWHGLNDGAFIYNIDLKPSMPVGASVFSRAGIYFDYNDVVMTNTAENKKGCPVPTSVISNIAGHHNIRLYPNPAGDELTIQMEQSGYTSFVISNTMGQQLIRQDITGTTININVKSLVSDVYYVTFKGEKGNVMRKFVKW